MLSKIIKRSYHLFSNKINVSTILFNKNKSRIKANNNVMVDYEEDIYNVYNKVIIDLCTHDLGDKMSQKDYNLAKEIDKII